ncbi:MAG: hypothetical protein HLUCCO16_00065 [Phormidium sp. OSCR]|nr:MAG: hypothetical protein HLUCCO16_00065 [Phormidium sp. OSCR]
MKIVDFVLTILYNYGKETSVEVVGVCPNFERSPIILEKRLPSTIARPQLKVPPPPAFYSLLTIHYSLLTVTYALLGILLANPSYRQPG